MHIDKECFLWTNSRNKEQQEKKNKGLEGSVFTKEEIKGLLFGYKNTDSLHSEFTIYKKK